MSWLCPVVKVCYSNIYSQIYKFISHHSIASLYPHTYIKNIEYVFDISGVKDNVDGTTMEEHKQGMFGYVCL